MRKSIRNDFYSQDIIEMLNKRLEEEQWITSEENLLTLQKMMKEM